MARSPTGRCEHVQIVRACNLEVCLAARHYDSQPMDPAASRAPSALQYTSYMSENRPRAATRPRPCSPGLCPLPIPTCYGQSPPDARRSNVGLPSRPVARPLHHPTDGGGDPGRRPDALVVTIVRNGSQCKVIPHWYCKVCRRIRPNPNLIENTRCRACRTRTPRENWPLLSPRTK